MSNDAYSPAIPPSSSGGGYATHVQTPLTGPQPEMLQLSWMQPPGLVALSFKNFLLRILTLGIYQFWGKTEVRKRIWSGIRINGEPLQYTGTGKELLLGFLMVLAVLTVPTLLLTLAAVVALGPTGADTVQGILMLAFLYLVGVGMHRAVRYRMSRTVWRSIRGGLEGSAWTYGWTYFWTGIVLVLTLGWASPWRSVKLQGIVTNGMRFGNRPFKFTATAGPLYGPFLALWLSVIAIAMLVVLLLYLALPAGGLVALTPGPGGKVDPALVLRLVAILYLGFFVGFVMFAVVSAWYRAQLMNHFAAHTLFEDARFQGFATGRSLIWLAVSNMLIVLLTLGLLAPVAQARSARYLVERLRIEGSARLAEILQRAEDPSGRGEGLAQAFDIDAF